MSQSYEILESTPTTYMVDYEYEPHIIINDDRTITIPEELVHIAVRGDHNIETVTFDCPRYWDNHDLSAMRIQINYRRPDGRIDPYPVKNIRVDEADDSQIHFDWTISGNVTEIKGNITFTVCAKLSDEEGNRELEWHSRMSHGLIIDDSLDCSGEELAKQYPDVIESILLRLDNIIDGSFVTIKSVTESTVDGGSNIVTFSDGTIVSIKNGSKGDVGPRGYKGDNGYTPQKGIDYWTEDEKAEIAELAADQTQNDFVALATGTKIEANTDLDTMLTFGNYKCTNKNTVKTLLNCPTDVPFIMRVGSPAPDVPNNYYQEIITLQGVRYYRYSPDPFKKVLWTKWRQSFESGQNISSDLGEVAHLEACQKFVDKMNETAAKIGMVNTTFNTPSGLCRKPINSGKVSYDTAYNSYTTARDLLRLMVAARHTPTVFRAMGADRCTTFINRGVRHAEHGILGSDGWKAWAQEHSYTILAVKGGSLKEDRGEIGTDGILNNVCLIQSGEDVYAVAVIGLTHDENETLRTLIHDLIGVAKGGEETAAIREAKTRNYPSKPNHPVGMAVSKLTKGCFDDDIAALENGIYYTGDVVHVAASTSKIVNALVTTRYMSNHKCSVNYDDLVGGSGITFAVGDEISTIDAMNLMLAVSDNTMATMLARVYGTRM